LNNSVSSITGGITAATNGLSAAGGLGTAVTSTINNLSGVASSVSSAAVGSVLNTTIGGIQNAVNNVSAIAGAGYTIAAGGTAALSNAASVVQQGASAAVSSALASGLSNLPGGIDTVNNVVNQAAGAINSIPGTGAITGAIKTAQTAAMNGLSTLTSASGALTSATSGITGALGSAASQLGGLTALASAGLPVGAIAQLQSSIASLAGGTPGAIALPSVAFNTTDRASITAQITSTLGDPGIPTPNLVGSIPDSAKSAVDDAKQKAEQEYQAAGAALDTKTAEIKVALDNYKKLDATLPPGDPAIDAAYQAYHALYYGADYTAIKKRYLAAVSAA
jgi:hypothetical protein